MRPPDGADDLVISTPERVAFQYPIAGIGSRFLAQVVDLLILSALFLVVGIAGAALGAVFHTPQLAILLWLLLSFVTVFGYFLVSEAVFGGQTVGKRALRMRVVGDHGEPILFSQAAIRNLIRIIDFLPVGYGIGLIALFINGRGKRLGDLAAGTLVVRERERISLYDLAANTAPQAPPTPAAAPSIWSTPSPTAEAGAPAPIPSGAGDPDRLRRLDPALRRLVVAYAARRASLPQARRAALAQSAEPALRRALPDVVASAGPLTALDQLAEWEGVTPLRRMLPAANWALRLGIASLVSDVFVILAPLGVIFGVAAIIVGQQSLRRVKAHPAELQGADRARTGRILGIIGLVIGALFVTVFVVGTILSR